MNADVCALAKNAASALAGFGKLVLWGAGGCGKDCLAWLESACGIGGRVAYFVDSGAKPGQSLFGLPVYPVARLSGCFADTAVILCSGVHYRGMISILARNYPNIDPANVYWFEDRKPAYYSNERHALNKRYLLDIYSGDPVTSQAIDLLLYARENNFGAVFPVSAANDIADSFFDYWCDDITTLERFDIATVIDGGAFTGDSIEMWHKRFGSLIARFYAVEPSEENIAALCATLSRNGIALKTTVLECALGDSAGVANFVSAGYESHVKESKGQNMVAINTLDSLIADVHGHLCVKMDIEGFELNALRGGKSLIRSHAPDLAICVYHKYDDVLDIPRYIKELNPQYKILLRGGAHMEAYASVHGFNGIPTN
jgi:FkbM family methyltransferase